ncbi:M20 family metallopeptidase [Luteipulveratus mongoliensis]|uniref:Probable succinyl-diaminopimelate desuccinylase n=1 Tax=Luteipulveratus mongoliensis TaxID=571913 RepID=A0A0K1JHY2_9MICO|nr:M20 family metallopeptidase [Luteipulveratus mongoliensis]AKU16311.1 acetylornithine deacetylase [Luteipulveratus mongoliensis]
MGTTRTDSLAAQPLSALETAVLALIDDGEVVRLTQRLVQAVGQNPPGEEAETVAALVAICRELGLDVSTSPAAPDRDNVHALTTGHDNGPGLLLLGHTDVVPLGDDWTVDPFGGLLRDGRVYGRGTTDMKGGLAAAVVAMAAVQRATQAAGVRLTGPIELAATVDEESTGIGVRHVVAQPQPRDYLGCITAEPTDLQTIVAARGDAYVRITVHGVAAHAGRPDDGRNAIYGAARVVESLRQWHEGAASDAHPLVGPVTWNVGRIEGGHGASIVPASATIHCDRRLLPDEVPADVLTSIQTRVDGLHLERDGLSVDVEMPMDMPGFETPQDDSFVLAVDGALAAAGGPGHPLGGWTAACDGGFIARDWHVPVIVLGPGSINDQAHRPDESVGVDELVTAARTYALAALRLLT